MNYRTEEIITDNDISVVNKLPMIGIENVQDEIIAGLKSESKFISSKYFYDKKGSKLFEQITGLDEYYPTRTEKNILMTIKNKLKLDFSSLNIIELGSGDPSKIRLLLGQLPANITSSISYFPVDISQHAIEESAFKLSEEFPMIRINGIVADFIHQLDLLPKIDNRFFCFFGSTIGNLNRVEIKEFMTNLSAKMRVGDGLLLGLDMVKDIYVLEKAYNDKQNVTAEFNVNILNVINNLIDSNFHSENFEHYAFYNKGEKRIEMHLKANRDLVVTINSTSDKIFIKKGETIHTENSHKFDRDNIKTMGHEAGLNVEEVFMDDNQWFSLVHYKKM